MKKFLLNLFFIILLIVVADVIFGFVVDALYQYVPTKQSYALRKCKDDIVILGSSRAENGFIPSIITDSTGMSCYNLAVGGQNIYYYYGILNTILTHHTPKIVIIDLTVIDYNYTPKWNTEKISALYPLYSHIDSVKRLINSVDFLNRFRLVSQTYHFNSTLFTLISSNIVEKNHQNDFINGFIPITKKHNKSACADYAKYQIDVDKLAIIKNIQLICNKYNIKLLFILSPQFLQLESLDQNIGELERIMYKSGYNIRNYSQDTALINYKNLFADPAHLNKYGAQKYSQIIVQSINEIFATRTATN